jgi:ABC-type sugar transport system permease subunit/ABC-type glycerol-3-phosphate transport system substrate-binding protein
MITARRASLLLAAALALAPRAAAAGPPGDRLHLTYWDKWTTFEKDAMQAVVDDFNASQSRIFVDFMSISDIDKRTLLAAAAGVPPDVAGVWTVNVVEYADKNAVLPLDDLARGTNVNADRYLPVYWNMGVYKGRLYGVPSTPATTGLYWNKKLFREAGLDPERPPRTIAELDQYAQKLTHVENGQITQVGFLPSEPRWWPFFWVNFFGGQLWDGGAGITLDAPANVTAFEWVQSYPKRYGVKAIANLSSGFGDFATPQDPFMSGKLAMLFQGVWLANYIHQYAPGLEFGAAPFPVLHEGDPPVVYVDSDMLIIPRGSKHPKEAFEFISFVARQEETEKLNLGQQKNSPLRDVSEAFFANHKHPQIRLFQDLAKSPRGIGQPKLSVWWEYRREIETVFQRVWLMRATPKEALSDGKGRIQSLWDRVRARQQLQPSRALAVAPFVLVGLLVALVVALAARGRVRRPAGPQAAGARRSVLANVSLGKGLLFFSPWGVGLLAFLAYPIAASLVYSFCDYSVLSAPRWVGLENFTDLLRDDAFWIALKNTVVYVALALPLGLVFSFFAALMLDAGVRGTGVYRTLVFLPSLTPVVASAMTWLWIFNSQYGVLNHLLGKLTFGLVGPVPWLVDPRTALPSLVLMSFWSVGQVVVILLAAMQDVPTALYEAADLDGAGWWRKVWHITIPLTSPVIYFNAIMGIIGGLQLFAQPYLMTEGGPARATLTYTMRLYQNAFTFLRMGYASAMAWILFLIILGLTAAAVRLSRTRVHYT